MNRAEKLLYDLVAIPSLSGAEREAVDFLVAAMAAFGLQSYRDAAGNALGCRENPNGAGQIEQEIMLLGHIDTVPGAIPVENRDGRLFGRGSVDAKGPLATFVVAASRATLRPGTRLVVVGAVEEESATSKGARQVAADFRPDYCIIGEPSGAAALTLGYKGRLLLDYELHQPAGHSAGPGRAAAEWACDFWNEIRDYCQGYNQERTRLFDQLLPSLRTMNTADDGLGQSATMTIGLRLPPDFDQTAFLANVERWAEPACLRGYAYEPAYAGKRTNPLAQTFNRTWRARGQQPRYKLKTGTSDMNVVAPIWGCPIAAYGPGDSQLDHTPEEHVEWAEYHEAIRQLTAVLEQL